MQSRLNDSNMVRDAADGIAARAGCNVTGDGYRDFVNLSFREVAQDILKRGGVLNAGGLVTDELFRRALATSDFTAALSAAGEKLVREAYDAIPLVHRDVFRKTSAKNFKPIQRPVVSAGSLLEKVPEGGPIPRHGASVEMASYSIDTYAKIIPITRRLLINDDIGLFASVARDRGRSAAETERAIVWNFINGNPDAPDGNPCFDNTNHGNYPAASATPISTATLAAARQALRGAKAPDGTKINATLAHVVVSDLGEVDYDALLNGLYVPTSASTAVTPSMRKVQLWVEPLVSETKKDWYGFADHRALETVEYAYLEGDDGPVVEQRPGFDTEGLDLKIRLDFGVGLIDHRGCFKQRES